MVCQLVMYSNVIVGIIISHDLFVFSQSHVKVSASLNNVGTLAVGAVDLVNHSLPAINHIGLFYLFVFLFTVCCFKFSSPSGKMVDKKGKRPLETRSTRRRYNEEHSDAEEIEWQSDDETDKIPKAISESM